jgi:hypothetical protein
MGLAQQPKHPAGSYHGKDFLDSNGISGVTIGVITRVDEIHMKADVHIVNGSDRTEIDLTQAMSGPRSFWGGCPEVNSVVVLGYRAKHKKLKDAMILGYLPSSILAGMKFDPIATDDSSNVTADEQELYNTLYSPTVRTKRLKLRPGDVGGMSADGSELVLNKSIQMVNRAGDLIELRDAERLFITQAVNSFHSASGVKEQYGPVRRGAFYLPYDIFQNQDPTKPLLEAPGGDATASPNAITSSVPSHYFGQSILELLGPGNPGDPQKFASTSGVVNSFFNNSEFPSVTYSNGKKTFFASNTPYANPESIKTPGDMYTEHRIELKHVTDGVQDMLDEIDGFNVDTVNPRVYIEHVMGTVVGNRTDDSDSMNLYGKVLKPTLFSNWGQPGAGHFKLVEAIRTAGVADYEVNNQAGAYLFRINHPEANVEENPFGICVAKQGKVYVNVPGSVAEDTYDGTKNVSVEASFGGGIKVYVGREVSTGESIRAFLEGGIEFEVGKNAVGKSIGPIYHGSVDNTYMGNDNEGFALSNVVRGNERRSITGDYTLTINGSSYTVTDGTFGAHATKILLNSTSGYTLNSSNKSETIAGQSQLNYGLAVIETIVAGGKVATILAGGLVQTVLAGAMSTSVLGGAISNFAGGAYSTVAGGACSTSAGGAITQAAGGAISLTAGAAVSVTAGLAMTLTAGIAVSLIAPQILLGGPAAVYGIARGLPILGPGVPTLDYITGLPLMGCAVSRSW